MKIIKTFTSNDVIRQLNDRELELGLSIIQKNLGFEPGNSILVVVDQPMLEQEAAIWFEAAKNLEDTKIKLLVLEGLTQSGQKTISELNQACKTADITLLQTSFSLTHTDAALAGTNNAGRVASLPMVNYEMLTRTLAADYQQIYELGESLKKAIQSGNEIRITSPFGTDITAKIRQDGIINDGGIIGAGEIGNLPGGEVFFAPLEGSTNGTWVINGSLADFEKKTSPQNPIKLIIKNGYVTKIKPATTINQPQPTQQSAQVAKQFWELLSKTGPQAFNVAEIGIGTNQSTNPLGEIIEAEKAYGTAHLAVGNNKFIGGSINVPIHLDGLTLEPTITIDNQVLLKEGEFVF